MMILNKSKSTACLGLFHSYMKRPQPLFLFCFLSLLLPVSFSQSWLLQAGSGHLKLKALKHEHTQLLNMWTRNSTHIGNQTTVVWVCPSEFGCWKLNPPTPMFMYLEAQPLGGDWDMRAPWVVTDSLTHSWTNGIERVALL